MNAPALKNFQEAAECLNCSIRTLRSLVAAQAISCVRIGRRIYFTDDDLAAFVDRQRIQGRGQNCQKRVQPVTTLDDNYYVQKITASGLLPTPELITATRKWHLSEAITSDILFIIFQSLRHHDEKFSPSLEEEKTATNNKKE